MFGRIIRLAAAVSAPLAVVASILTPAHAAASRTVKWTNTPGQEKSIALITLADLQGFDPTLDILASQITGSRAALDTVTTMAQVSTSPPRTGDGIVVETFFTYQMHTYYLVAQRTIAGDTFTLEYLDNSTTPGQYHKLPCDTCTGSFDSTKNTISFHIAMKTLNGVLHDQKVAAMGKNAKLTALETDSLIFRGVPGVGGLVGISDTSKPKDPTTALIIP